MKRNENGKFEIESDYERNLIRGALHVYACELRDKGPKYQHILDDVDRMFALLKRN